MRGSAVTRIGRVLACVLIGVSALSMSGCSEGGGIGIGVPASGARWGGGNSGPGVLVAGGPEYR